MEDSLLIDAVERFVNGEMTPQEKSHFEDLRKNNPELDQAVVEYVYFLNEVNKHSDTKRFQHHLHEVENKLKEDGFSTMAPIVPKAKIVQLWTKYKRTVAVAASIACMVSLFIAGLISSINTKTAPNIKPLVDKSNIQDHKIRQIESKLNRLEAGAIAETTPKFEEKFRGTGFLIDVNNNYIITNAHVAKEAKNQLIIENSSGVQFKADAVYVDVQRDLAILKVRDSKFKKLPSLPFSIRKKYADLGESVFMLGFPKQEIVYGEGYISAKNGFQMDTIYCQLNTAANEGSSGSPVITRNGELIGILTSAETNAQGVVYAIKSANIYRAIEEAKKIDENADMKITSNPSLKGLNRESQIKKLEDYVFMIKGN